MGKEHPSANQRVWLVSSHFFEPLQQGVVDPPRTKLDDQFIVVNRGLFSIFGHGALHVPGGDHLLVDLNI